MTLKLQTNIIAFGHHQNNRVDHQLKHIDNVIMIDSRDLRSAADLLNTIINSLLPHLFKTLTNLMDLICISSIPPEN